MKDSSGQGEIFYKKHFFEEQPHLSQKLLLKKESIQNWQLRIHAHQSEYFQGGSSITHQTNLFESTSTNLIDDFEPLMLTPLPLNFWRSSTQYHEGPAIYLVMDQFDDDKKNIILYLGETIAADQRWKGEHDCKGYLDNYCCTLNRVNLNSHLSIRFWTDVPKQTRSRRKLEQDLIQRWLPPFNKETRSRWQTPFTNEIN